MKRLCAAVIVAVVVALCMGDVAESQCCPGGVCRPPQQWTRAQAPAARPHPAVPRVTVHYGNISHPVAGVLVGRREDADIAYVLTAAHAFIQGRKADRITVVFSNGEGFLADPRAINHDWDAAVLAITRPRVAPIALASTAPTLGEPLTLMGYGQGRWRRFGGGLRGFVSPGKLGIYEFLDVNAAAIEGDSGGPIVNRQGQLVGIISGEAQGVTCGPVCTRLKQLFGALLPPYRTRVAVLKPKQPAATRPVDEGPPLPDKPMVPMKMATAAAKRPIDAALAKPLQARIAKLEQQLAELKPVPGPRGPQGMMGPIGPQGMMGPVDPKRLPPITVQTISNGKVIETREVFLGGLLSLKLVPVGGSK